MVNDNENESIFIDDDVPLFQLSEEHEKLKKWIISTKNYKEQKKKRKKKAVWTCEKPGGKEEEKNI